LRLEVVLREEAIRGFEHGAIATGFGPCGCGVRGQDVRTFHQALCAPQIAEFGIGTLNPSHEQKDKKALPCYRIVGPWKEHWPG
jgi:hypothetical protein